MSGHTYILVEIRKEIFYKLRTSDMRVKLFIAESPVILGAPGLFSGQDTLGVCSPY
jgi:hypothetical protein